MCSKCETELKEYPFSQWLGVAWACRHLEPDFAAKLDIRDGDCLVVLPFHGSKKIHKDILFAFKYEDDYEYFLEFITDVMGICPAESVRF